MKADVEKRFDSTLKKTFSSKPDILKFLINHERKYLVIDNLCYQIRLAELGKNKLDIDKYNMLISDMARFFAQNALEYKKQQILSDNEKKRLIEESDKLKEAQDAFEQMEKELEDNRPKIFVPNSIK